MRSPRIHRAGQAAVLTASNAFRATSVGRPDAPVARVGAGRAVAAVAIGAMALAIAVSLAVGVAAYALLSAVTALVLLALASRLGFHDGSAGDA